VVVSIDEILDDLNERRAIATKKYLVDPLPAGAEEARRRLEGEIDRYGLAPQVAELEIQGYTILPPGRVAPAGFIERLRDAILEVADDRATRGAEGDLPLSHGLGRQLHCLVTEGPVFEQALMNPVVLALVTYLAGYRAKISTATGLIKSNESDAPLRWHCDNSAKLGAPWPSLSQGANVNWLLTDYSRENGALCVVPGSHLWCRPPDPGFRHDDPSVEVIEAPAGSVAVWHSNLWHAALPRSAPGKRVSLVTFFMRSHLQAQEPYFLTTTAEMLERNDARFGVLTGVLSEWPFGINGPQLDLAPARTQDLGRWT